MREFTELKKKERFLNWLKTIQRKIKYEAEQGISQLVLELPRENRKYDKDVVDHFENLGYEVCIFDKLPDKKPIIKIYWS